MKKRFCLLVIALLMLTGTAFAETLTFQWEQSNLTNLKEWKILWSDTQGGPYEQLTTIPYDGGVGPIFTSPADAQVTGDQGTHVIKYFVAIACGNIPQINGTIAYKCSIESNEVNHDFWIPSGMFSVPVYFEIIPNP